MNRLDPAAVPLEGPTLIEASAGTGKTYTIATLFVRLLLERQLEVAQILVVTYTRAATSELRDRIRRRLIETLGALDHGSDDPNLHALLAARSAPEQRARDRAALIAALREFDQASIFTIHGFCQHALREWAFESGAPFELELSQDQGPLLREIALDYYARTAYGAGPELVAALRKQRGKPDDLAMLAAKSVRDPQMAVLPEQVPELQLALGPFVDARGRAAALWAEDRSAILHALCTAGLSRQSYAETTMRGDWAEELDELGTTEVLELPDFLPKLRQSKLDEAKKAAPLRHSFFVAIDALCTAASTLTAALEHRVLGVRLGLVHYARSEAARRRTERAAHSFDDLLHALHGALLGAGGAALARGIRERHAAALIDEFQDTDPVQYGIFRHIFAEAGAPLFLIGDPKQAIYGFRGADVFAYLNAARECAAAVYTLDVNYRSDPRLLQALATLIGNSQRPFLLPEIRFEPVRPEPRARERLRPETPALQLLFVPRDARTQDKKVINKTWADRNGAGGPQLPELVAHEILQLLRSGATIDLGDDPQAPRLEPIKPRHIAVLCRTNAQARAVQQALAALSVPTVLEGDSSVFEQETAEELAQVLWAIAEPADRRKLNAALSTAILGVPGETLHRMQHDESELDPWLERVARWSQLWHERGFVQMVQRVLDDGAVHERLLARSDGERRLTDLLHLCELLHRASVEQHLGPLSLLHWFAEMRNDPEARTGIVADSEQMRLEHDEHAVKLTTVHRSKGLEHPVVFCPYLWCGPGPDDKDVRFHDRADDDRVKLDLGSADHAAHEAAAKREDLAERLRLLYVALTRAKHRCYVVWGRFWGSEHSALGYLLHPGKSAEAPEPEAIKQRIAQLTDRQILTELDALCAASGGSIGVREIAFERPAPYVLDEPVQGELRALEPSRTLDGLPRMTSFSRLVEGAAAPHAPAEDSRDHDATEPGADSAEAPAPAAAAAPNVALHAFPTGSRPGSLIHSVFEHIDFTRADPNELAAQVDRQLGLYGVDAATHRDALIAGIEQCLLTPLAAGSPLRLGDLARADRVDELEFTLSAGRGAHPADLTQLADAFTGHAAPACDPDYGARLRALGPAPAAPFLKGFIDLVFRAEQRFYIVDYKSNWLGVRAADYAQPRLVRAMREHHYFLQYHLYTLALHRYLRQRLPGYDYAQHFGGVYYLFLRGMAPAHPEGSGVFFDRPSLELIEALAAALGAAEAA